MNLTLEDILRLNSPEFIQSMLEVMELPYITCEVTPKVIILHFKNELSFHLSSNISTHMWFYRVYRYGTCTGAGRSYMSSIRQLIRNNNKSKV